MAKAKAASAEDLEEVEETEGAAEQPKRKWFVLPAFTLKNLIIMGAAVLLLAGGGAGAYFLLFKKPAPPKPAEAVVKPVVFVDLPDVLVNLANPGNERTQYLKIKVVLELPDQAAVAQINPVMPRVMDAFQTYLRELRASDLDGSAGLYRLKEELTRRVNLAIAPAKINAVLFKEIVVQ